VPTYREADNLRPLVERIARSMRAAGRAFEVIVVDDDSRDGTEQICRELAGEGHPLRLITRVGQRGLSSAVIRGFEESADGADLACMDADLSHPPEALPRLLEELGRPGVEFVIGSRYVPGASTAKDWGAFRRLNSKVASLLARPFTRVKDPMAGFFALRRSVFERCDRLNPIGYKIGLEIIVKGRCGQVREVPICFADRTAGQSKMTVREQMNYLRHLKRLAEYKFGAVVRLLEFCAVGATGMVVDLTTYALLLTAGLLLPAARAIAILTAMTWNFALNRRVTFADRERSGVLGQYLRFVLSCSLGALLSWSVAVGLPAAASWFADHVYAAALLGIVLGTGCNFLLSLGWVFR